MRRVGICFSFFCVSRIAYGFSPKPYGPTNNEIRQQQSSICTSLMATNQDRCDVAVFGGGFGGLYTALAISRDARSRGRTLDVALVEPSDKFVFLPLLYDLTVGTASESEVCPTYKDILVGTGVRHVRASLDCYSSPDLYSANITTTTSLQDGGGKDTTTATTPTTTLSFRSSVVAVGATPQSTLASVPGALEYTQPFYTQENAKETRELLARFESSVQDGTSKRPRLAIIGGGYGGVELAACIKRKLPQSSVSLLTRGPPMEGTRAEALVEKALKRLGVNVDVCSVEEIIPVKADDNGDVSAGKSNQVLIKTSAIGTEGMEDDSSEPWDAVLWTAGSGPAYPVSEEKLSGLSKVESGRLAIDSTLRCLWSDENSQSTSKRLGKPPVWALGDCTEIVDNLDQPVVPKTAQAAMQQADIVAFNLLADLQSQSSTRTFQFQDLGSMLTLGGPNGAILAPRDDSPLAPVLAPLFDTARVGFGLADEVFAQLTKSPVAEKVGLTPVVENLGLSLGGYGLGVDSDTSPGTLSGTLTGAARRAVYAVRMPTNRQRAYAAASAAISTAAALAKEANDQIEKSKNGNEKDS